jgi:hypothetical protein
MVKKKIIKFIVSNKIKINNYLNNKKVITINELEREALKQNFISVTFDDYLKNKINTKNMIHGIMICLVCIILALRLLIGAFITDPKIWVLIADPFYLIGDRVFLSLIMAGFIVAGVKMRMICILSKYSIFYLFVISICPLVRNKAINYLKILIKKN